MFLTNRCRVAPTLFFAAVAMCMIGQPVLAQNAAPVPLSSPTIMQTNDPKNLMHYTPQQQQSMIALRNEMQKQATKVIEDNTLSQTDKQQRINAIRTSALAKFQDILTPAQKAKNAQLQTAVKAINDQYLALNKQLIGSLSADQKTKITAARSSAASKQQAINNGPGTDEDKRSQLQELQTSYEEQVNAIFTTRQLAIIKQMTALRQSIPTVEQKVLTGK